MKNQIGLLMQQAKAMQEKLKDTQDELAKTKVSGQSGAGMVKITMDCQYGVSSLDIDSELLKDDIVILEEMIVGAFNDAIIKVKEEQKKKMSGAAAGGLDLSQLTSLF